MLAVGGALDRGDAWRDLAVGGTLRRQEHALVAGAGAAAAAAGSASAASLRAARRRRSRREKGAAIIRSVDQVQGERRRHVEQETVLAREHAARPQAFTAAAPLAVQPASCISRHSVLDMHDRRGLSAPARKVQIGPLRALADRGDTPLQRRRSAPPAPSTRRHRDRRRSRRDGAGAASWAAGRARRAAALRGSASQRGIGGLPADAAPRRRRSAAPRRDRAAPSRRPGGAQEPRRQAAPAIGLPDSSTSAKDLPRQRAIPAEKRSVSASSWRAARPTGAAFARRPAAGRRRHRAPQAAPPPPRAAAPGHRDLRRPGAPAPAERQAKTTRSRLHRHAAIMLHAFACVPVAQQDRATVS